MAKHPEKGRSGVTNGTRVFLSPVLDSVSGRRFADLLHAAERERGGRDAMTVTQQEAARQWAGLCVAMEQLHADLAAGKSVDLEALGQIGDRADRQARRMGPVKPEARRTVLDRLIGGQ